MCKISGSDSKKRRELPLGNKFMVVHPAQPVDKRYDKATQRSIFAFPGDTGREIRLYFDDVPGTVNPFKKWISYQVLAGTGLPVPTSSLRIVPGTVETNT